MYKGIYIALSGAILKQNEIDIISRNLANVDTPGYKRDRISFKEHLLSAGDVWSLSAGRVMSEVAEVETDFSMGELVKTGKPLDIAIDGGGFLHLEGDRYTRKGSLKLDAEGYLRTASGYRVLGKSGPIQLPPGTVEISITGDISVDGKQIDTLDIVDFPDLKALVKSGAEFVTDQEPIAAKAVVLQGYIESSNVKVIHEMARMITVVRQYQAYQKAIQAFDEATSKVTNEMARRI
jgi:flagellar basal-body rod protein FlgG